MGMTDLQNGVVLKYIKQLPTVEPALHLLGSLWHQMESNRFQVMISPIMAGKKGN